MKALATLILLIASAGAQTVIVGNSEVFQAPWQYSGIAPPLSIRGHDSATCAILATWLPGDVPEGTRKVSLAADSTNDALHGVSPQDAINCVKQQVEWLQDNRPGIQISVANTPPMVQFDPCSRSMRPAALAQLIMAYNVQYVALNGYLQADGYQPVTLVDVWTGIHATGGWAWLIYMDGDCYIHFGPAGVQSPGWQFFMGKIATGLSTVRTSSTPAHAWDIVCLSTINDWISALNAHDHGWTLDDSQEISAGAQHCMAFYQSSDSYHGLVYTSVVQTYNWSVTLDQYLYAGYFKLDSWTPLDVNPFAPHYMAFALR